MDLRRIEWTRQGTTEGAKERVDREGLGKDAGQLEREGIDELFTELKAPRERRAHTVVGVTSLA